MEKPDYYEILGIPRNAEEREIKKAYKRLAMKFHPDRNPGNATAESKFKEIKEAYEILMNAQSRAAYDQYGHAAFNQTTGTSSGSHFSSTSFSDIFGDVFGDIFGGNRRTRANRGSDLKYNIEISLEEAVRGVTRKICVPTLEGCNVCYGSGAKPGTSAVNCSSCHGQGQIQTRQGFFTVQQTCPHCQGQGKMIKDICHKCRGHGRIEASKVLFVKIPSGVNTGDNVKLTGEGEAGERGAPSGDVYVQIKVRKHHIFDREDSNLCCEIPINFTTAALGGEVEVPTLDGRMKLKIPPETQTGKLFRIRGKGIKSIRNGYYGDLLCRVIVETPVKLNERQKYLLKELGTSFTGPSGDQNSPRSKNFIDSVKKFFDDLTR